MRDFETFERLRAALEPGQAVRTSEANARDRGAPRYAASHALKLHVCAALVVLAACAPEPRRFELRDVVDERRAQLVSALPPAEPLPSIDPDEADRVRSFVDALHSMGGDWRIFGAETAADFGRRAIPTLAAIVADPDLPATRRIGAVRMLSVLDDPAAQRVLIAAIERSPEVWIRRHAAHEIGASPRDECVPRLVRRLRDETDDETRLWIAVSLSRLGVHAGIHVALHLAAPTVDTALSRTARDELEAWTSRAKEPDPRRIAELWLAGDPLRELPTREPSPALRAEAWSWICDLNVRDADADFVLANLPAWIAPDLALALHDREPRVRERAVRALDALGRRAVEAAPTLVAALAEPTLAARAASALGRIGDPASAAALLESLESSSDEALVVACARALGQLRAHQALATLERLAASGRSPRVVSAALAARLTLARTPDAARAAAEHMRAAPAEAADVEQALFGWIDERAATNDAEAMLLRTAWIAASEAPNERERRARRAALVIEPSDARAQ